MKARVLPFRQATGESDAVLLKQIAAGDEKAEAALVGRYSRGLMVMLVARTRDPSLAQDIHQETLTILLNAARQDKIRKPESLKGYIQQSAMNTLLNYRRRERRSPIGVNDEAILRHADESSGPLARLESAQVLKAIGDSIASLAVRRDRQLLRRYFVDEVGKNQICRELGLTSQHFDRVLYRARKRFRAIFETHGESSGPTSS